MTTSPDPLSLMLRELRFSGALCVSGVFSAPWGLRGPDADVPLFHFVHEGQAVISLGETVHYVEPGDLVVFPRGSSHTIHDGSGKRCTPIDELLPQRKTPGVHRIALGEGPITTRTVCGIFFIDEKMMLPFWSSLPTTLHIQRDELARQGWLPGLLKSLADELESASLGATVLATKMSEVVFLLALRCYLERSATHATGWLYALQEPRLGRVMSAIHGECERHWTLAELATLAGMSRSVFSATFKQHTGESPMSYLTLIRMRQAIRLMASGRWELKEIGEKVGFHSYIGFHNAFKRMYHCTPGHYREQFRHTEKRQLQ